MRKKVNKEPSKIEVPFDVALSLLKPDELDRLKKYVDAYVIEYGDGEQKGAVSEQDNAFKSTDV